MKIIYYVNFSIKGALHHWPLANLAAYTVEKNEKGAS